MPHAHVHAPHELTEGNHALGGWEQGLEIVAAFLMACATVAIAWSGYQAARWSGLQAREYASANSARADANRLSTLAGQERIQDLLNFNRWLEVSTSPTLDDDGVADLYRRRFRPEFVPAFEAWLAQDPLHNENAVASPLRMPEYRIAEFEQADRLEATAGEHFATGKEATERADQYVLVTVFLAAVLFFAGISLRFAWWPMRVSIVALGVVFLLVAVVRLLVLPSR